MKLKNFYQNIFNKQDVKEGTEAIENFLNLDEDIDPFEELTNMKLSDDTRDSMEGKITLQEMTKSLNEDMKATSVPGVEGFTANFICKF